MLYRDQIMASTTCRALIQDPCLQGSPETLVEVQMHDAELALLRSKAGCYSGCKPPSILWTIGPH